MKIKVIMLPSNRNFYIAAVTKVSHQNNFLMLYYSKLVNGSVAFDLDEVEIKSIDQKYLEDVGMIIT